MFPKLEKQGSLLVQGIKNKANKPKGPTGSAFQTVPTGLKSAVDAIVGACQGVEFRTGTSVEKLEPTGGKYTVALSTGETVEADAVILATPAYVASGLMKDFRSDVAAELDGIPYGNSCVVALAYNRKDVEHPLDASGFLVPHTEPMNVTASTWVSIKWPHSAPEGKVLMRCFVGRGAGKDWTKESDEVIIAEARKGLEEAMGLKAEPTLARVYRWPRAMAQYRVGHLERIDRIDALMQTQAGLYVAGAAYRGVGIGDCVREGNTAAERTAKHLGWTAGGAVAGAPGGAAGVSVGAAAK
jgi:oxygen-dependent protoporphyrinogen oxidase